VIAATIIVCLVVLPQRADRHPKPLEQAMNSWN
jgi:hypothetical protein